MVKIEGLFSQDSFGQSMTTLGDIDHDGFSDIAIGAPSIYHRAHSGSVYLFSGAILQEGGSVTPYDAVFQIQGEERASQLGFSMIYGGDIDKDGTEDLIVGSLGAEEEKGGGYVFSLPQ